MINYVLGFIFDEEYKNVVLIRKGKETWQKDIHNGIGGKVENDEEPIVAIVRECIEETGLYINSWRQYCVMYGPEFTCICYSTTADLNELSYLNDKEIPGEGILSIVPVKDLYHLPRTSNLIWLIELAADKSDTRYSVNATIDQA